MNHASDTFFIIAFCIEVYEAMTSTEALIIGVTLPIAIILLITGYRKFGFSLYPSLTYGLPLLGILFYVLLFVDNSFTDFIYSN